MLSPHFVEFVVIADGEDHRVDLPEELDVVRRDVPQVDPAQLARVLGHGDSLRGSCHRGSEDKNKISGVKKLYRTIT